MEKKNVSNDKLSDHMSRMLRNACACGAYGLWVYGRSEISIAKALERRGFVRVDRHPGRLGDFTSQLMPVIIHTIRHDENCNCLPCRTIRWRKRMNLAGQDVVGSECLLENKTTRVLIVKDLGFADDKNRIVRIASADEEGLTETVVCINSLYPPVI